jgi:hypothetical protein
MVQLVTHGATRWLFTGDVTAQGEAELAARRLATGQALGPVDVLKVTHHGSASGSSAPFLALARPARAVIGVGPNSFGHPTAAALGRLQAVGAEVLRTDVHGTVVLISDGVSVGVELAPHIALVPTGLALPPSEPEEALAENALAPFGSAPAPPLLPATGDPVPPAASDPDPYLGQINHFNRRDSTGRRARQVNGPKRARSRATTPAGHRRGHVKRGSTDHVGAALDTSGRLGRAAGPRQRPTREPVVLSRDPRSRGASGG